MASKQQIVLSFHYTSTPIDNSRSCQQIHAHNQRYSMMIIVHFYDNIQAIVYDLSI